MQTMGEGRTLVETGRNNEQTPGKWVETKPNRAARPEGIMTNTEKLGCIWEDSIMVSSALIVFFLFCVNAAGSLYWFVSAPQTGW